ncbi:hypothetical protein N658DRAFT_260032 [Parathielavia hyrcaniae]|uniref:Uncharacterized protein n=1 Tax=Parathielavia hyrcaniae TaxID=113614 RepID=A0AAN6PU02_9PEZI|nr:hypothetical protein N658DRAFT_260032 [Parathielavia hyrcaniae]
MSRVHTVTTRKPTLTLCLCPSVPLSRATSVATTVAVRIPHRAPKAVEVLEATVHLLVAGAATPPSRAHKSTSPKHTGWLPNTRTSTSYALPAMGLIRSLARSSLATHPPSPTAPARRVTT